MAQGLFAPPPPLAARPPPFSYPARPYPERALRDDHYMECQSHTYGPNAFVFLSHAQC